MSENKFTSKQIKYAHWKANPYRTETKEEFAKTLKVVDKTLRRWDKISGFKEFVDDLILQYVGSEEAEVWKAMIGSAKSKLGNADRKLFFQMTGKYVEKREDKLSGEVTSRIIQDFNKQIDESE